MPHIAIVYHSGYGHTQRVAEAVAKGAEGELLAIDTAPDAFRRLWITPAGFGYDYTACPVTVTWI